MASSFYEVLDKLRNLIWKKEEPDPTPPRSPKPIKFRKIAENSADGYTRKPCVAK